MTSFPSLSSHRLFRAASGNAELSCECGTEDVETRAQIPPQQSLSNTSVTLRSEEGGSALAEMGQSSATGRFERPSHFPARPGIIPTNIALRGAVGNVTTQGDDLGRCIGRLIPRQFMTEAIGVVAGLTLMAGFYSIFVALAALRADRVPQRRIEGCLALWATLQSEQRQTPAAAATHRNTDQVISAAVDMSRRQKREAYGLWLTAAGSLTSLITRLGSDADIATGPLLAATLISPGLCAFGLVQTVNDLMALRGLHQIQQNRMAQSLSGGSSPSRLNDVETFGAAETEFFHAYASLLRFAIANSALLAVAGALAPLFSALSLGGAGPILGGFLGASTFRGSRFLNRDWRRRCLNHFPWRGWIRIILVRERIGLACTQLCPILVTWAEIRKLN